MTDSYLAPAPAPKQLDIIADTILRGPRQTPGDLSTSPENKTPGDLSTGGKSKTPGDLSTTMKQIDARRKKLGVTIGKLCAAAKIHPDTYDDARAGRSRPRPVTIRKLARALAMLAAGQEGEDPRTLCQSYLQFITVDLARRSGWDPQLMLAQNFEAENTNDPVWLQASRLRRCAIYLLVEGLYLGKAKIAAAIGVTRQAVHKTVAAIESERDRDSALDTLMETMMLQLKVTR